MANKNPRTKLTPLWIISLFVTLTETALSVSVTRTQGAIQVALTVFVITYAILVTGAFFFVLWYRPYVFYPPSEFTETKVSEYVDAFRQSRFEIVTEQTAPERDARDLLHKFWKPDGKNIDGRNEARLREWMKNNGYGNVSITMFLGAEDPRKAALQDLGINS
jgi:hypothetical protein